MAATQVNTYYSKISASTDTDNIKQLADSKIKSNDLFNNKKYKLSNKTFWVISKSNKINGSLF